MLQILHKVLAIIIALVVLLSSLSFTVQKRVHLIEATDNAYHNISDTCRTTIDKCDMESPSESEFQKNGLL